jgi:class 3 adenylate cyclase/predicted ATPase
MDVVGWLRGLGLEQYEAAFRENEIDDTVLPNLTADDLKDLGVGIVGHRRKLLDAIAALRAQASAQTPLSEALLATDKAAQDTAERRQVTVMFSDLVGSTALSTRMDPEDLREVISAYQHCVAETVQRFGGFVAKYMGDGVLIYFGYPQAHEDDAERAVRAGLELVAALGVLKTHAPLQTRVGIATGLVVVGDLIGSGASQEQAIVGETPNLAARLQGVAEPNGVVIAESTRRLLGNLFELEDFGPQTLKGVEGPIRAWAALRSSSIESRFEALHAGGMTELVGREEELGLLLRRWARAKTGEGQVVLLSGEAGIGKSRLSAAIMEAIAAEPHTRLRYFCSPQHTDGAFYPLIGQFERAAGFAHGDTPQAKLDKLDALLAQSATSADDAALFAEMLSLPNDGRYPAPQLTPQQRRQGTLEALVLQVTALSSDNPVLMIFEDAHWTDPTSLELFGRIVDKIPTLRVLLIVAFRPEFEPPWIGRPYVTAVTINRLAEREVSAMIDRVVGNKLLPASVRQDIVDRTDGIPLFVEEMTKAVVEAEGEGAAERAVSVAPSPTLAVPASLHASLMARLDRLGSAAREVSQIGASIGREFSHAVLAAVVRKPEAELRSGLDRLIQAGLLFRQGIPPHATYLFKHALVQDAAYGTLLREPRRAIHARIAEALESQFAEPVESKPELLAHHYTLAGLTKQAIDYWQRAGGQAAKRSANVEAAAHLTRGLALIQGLPQSEDRLRLEVQFHTAIGVTMMATKGWGAPEVLQAYSAAKILCERLGDPNQLFTVLRGEGQYHMISGNVQAADELARQCMQLAEHASDPAFILEAHHVFWSTRFYMGDYVTAEFHANEGIAIYDPVEHHPLTYKYSGHDPGVCCRGFSATALWVRGYPDQALNRCNEALTLANQELHPLTVALAYLFLSQLHVLRHEADEGQRWAEKQIEISEKYVLPLMLAQGRFLLGWALAEQGDLVRGIELIRNGITATRATGAMMGFPFFLSVLAGAYLDSGELSQAAAMLDEALSVATEARALYFFPEVLRTKGKLLFLQDPDHPEAAQACFQQAVTAAREQGAKSFELRAAMSMARLWRDQGKRDEARELLAPVYGWFTEGFDTLDLKQAKALLDELAA